MCTHDMMFPSRIHDTWILNTYHVFFINFFLFCAALETWTTPVAKMSASDFVPQDGEGGGGCSQHFECQVIGYPTPTIRWFKDDVEITKSDRVQIGYDESTGIVTLAIKNLVPSDEGCYQCRAENSEGYATTTAYLVVTGESVMISTQRCLATLGLPITPSV